MDFLLLARFGRVLVPPLPLSPAAQPTRMSCPFPALVSESVWVRVCKDGSMSQRSTAEREGSWRSCVQVSGEKTEGREGYEEPTVTQQAIGAELSPTCRSPECLISCFLHVWTQIPHYSRGCAHTSVHFCELPPSLPTTCSGSFPSHTLQKASLFWLSLAVTALF